MPTNIRIIHAHDFLQVTPEGRLNFEDSKKLLVEIAAATPLAVPPEIILDTRKVQSDLSATDLYDLVSELGNYRQAFARKIAVLCPLKQFDSAGFFALCAKNRGFQVQAFTSYEEAIEWLV